MQPFDLLSSFLPFDSFAPNPLPPTSLSPAVLALAISTACSRMQDRESLFCPKVCNVSSTPEVTDSNRIAVNKTTAYLQVMLYDWSFKIGRHGSSCMTLLGSAMNELLPAVLKYFVLRNVNSRSNHLPHYGFEQTDPSQSFSFVIPMKGWIALSTKAYSKLADRPPARFFSCTRCCCRKAETFLPAFLPCALAAV